MKKIAMLIVAILLVFHLQGIESQAEERERTFNDMINISLETAIAGK